jgi:hypothetical protein
MQDHHRRLEVNRSIDTAENPGMLRPLCMELCDNLRETEERAATAFYRGEKLMTKLAFALDQSAEVNRGIRGGTLGNLDDMKSELAFFRQEREWLYNKLLLLHALHMESSFDSAAAAGLHNANYNSNAAAEAGEMHQSPEMRRLRRRIIDMQSQVVQWKRREQRLVQRCSVYEKNLMTAQERIQALEDEFGNMRAKMVKKLEDETDRRVQVGRQAAELQSQLQTRKNFFLTQSYQLRAAIERLGHDKKSFLTAAVRLSGVNKQGEEVRTAFTMVLEAFVARATQRLPEHNHSTCSWPTRSRSLCLHMTTLPHPFLEHHLHARALR